MDWIFIGYFLIGSICGVIAARAYTKEYGDSPISVLFFSVIFLLGGWFSLTR